MKPKLSSRPLSNLSKASSQADFILPLHKHRQNLLFQRKYFIHLTAYFHVFSILLIALLAYVETQDSIAVYYKEREQSVVSENGVDHAHARDWK